MSQWPCLNGTNATVVAVPGTSPVLNLAVVGSGNRAVVFSDESDADLCSWLPYARTLAGDGLRVVLYDYSLGPGDDLAHVTGYLRAHAAHGTALLARPPLARDITAFIQRHDR
jgi:hypothetical protein